MREQLHLYSAWDRLVTDEEHSATTKVGISQTTALLQNWQQTLSLDLQQDIYKVGDDSDKTNLLIPGISWSYLRGEQAFYPLGGMRFDISLRGSAFTKLPTQNFSSYAPA